MYSAYPSATRTGSSWGSVSSNPVQLPPTPFIGGDMPLPKTPSTVDGVPAVPNVQLHPWLRYSRESLVPPLSMHFQRICRTSTSHEQECQNISVPRRDPTLSMSDPATHPPARKLVVHVFPKTAAATYVEVYPRQGTDAVTIKDLVMGIVEILQRRLPQSLFIKLSGELQNVSMAAFQKRAGDRKDIFQQGMKLVDLLSDSFIFAGLSVHYDGLVLETTFERRRSI